MRCPDTDSAEIKQLEALKFQSHTEVKGQII